MNLKKIKKINEELDLLPTITEKLDSYKSNYLDKYHGELLFEFYEIENESDDHLSGPLKLPTHALGRILIPSLDIPKSNTSDKYRMEYHNWILLYSAKRMFEEKLKPFYETEILKSLGVKLIKGKIKSLTKIQRNGDKLLENEGPEIYKKNNLSPEKLYLWYKNGYYNEFSEWIDNYEIHAESICNHKYLLPFLRTLIKINTKKNEILRLLNFNIEKLVSELLKRNFFDKKDKARVISWFKGIIQKEPIHINKPMNQLSSLIATCCEEGFIKNTKVFCYDLIQHSFLFKNKKADLGSIVNAMKKNSPERIKKEDSLFYIDIQPFIIKN